MSKSQRPEGAMVMVPLRFHCDSADVIKALKAEARRTGKGVPEDYPGFHKTLWTAALIIEQAEEAFAINTSWQDHLASPQQSPLSGGGRRRRTGAHHAARDRPEDQSQARCQAHGVRIAYLPLCLRGGRTMREDGPSLLAPRPPATPGPWKACGTVYEHMNAEIRSGAKGQGLPIAQVWDADNAFSNALLLAAAPQLRDSLLLAISHIEHMAAWISRDNRGYSFEALGEDMATIKAPLRDIVATTPGKPSSASEGVGLACGYCAGTGMDDRSETCDHCDGSGDEPEDRQ